MKVTVDNIFAKTVILHIGQKNCTMLYDINGINITSVTSVKDLIYVNNDLSWRLQSIKVAK